MFQINPDITAAETIHTDVYTSKEIFEQQKEKIFARSWQVAAFADEVKTPGQTFPFVLLPGYLNEPLLLTRDYNDELHCLSNVCTHRGNLVCERGGIEKNLRCRYHGRRFELNGKFSFMPEFEEVKNFPSEKDNLASVPFAQWNPFIFCSLLPAFHFEEAFDDMLKRIGWMKAENFLFSINHSKDYLVNANWALYVENYLEGFHIPYVHASLNQVLDYNTYAYEIYPYSNLQIGYAKSGEEFFQLPSFSPEFGKSVAAYYFWIFPNLMFNFYPWGLSVNVVKPLSVNQTKISFLTFIGDQNKFEQGAITMTDRVEREDETIVENVQRGVQSHFYKSGRYSPTKERGTHHFHQLLAKFLNE